VQVFALASVQATPHEDVVPESAFNAKPSLHFVHLVSAASEEVKQFGWAFVESLQAPELSHHDFVAEAAEAGFSQTVQVPAAAGQAVQTFVPVQVTHEVIGVLPPNVALHFVQVAAELHSAQLATVHASQVLVSVIRCPIAQAVACALSIGHLVGIKVEAPVQASHS